MLFCNFIPCAKPVPNNKSMFNSLTSKTSMFVAQHHKRLWTFIALLCQITVGISLIMTSSLSFLSNGHVLVETHVHRLPIACCPFSVTSTHSKPPHATNSCVQLSLMRAPRASQRCAQGRYRAQDMRALPPSPRALVVVLYRDDEENDALREEAPAHEARRECGGQG